MKTFSVEFLGCKVNAWEAEALREGLSALGLSEAPLSEPSDLYVLNTCSVTSNAGSTSRNRVRRALRRNQETRVLVTGCYAESDRDRVAAISGVDRVFGNDEKDAIVPFVKREILDLPEDHPVPPFRITAMSGQTRAFVKIEDGCDDGCTFCIIPSLRGHAQSRDPDEITEEVGDLVRSGHREVVLTGVHIGYFGKGDGLRGSALVRLLRRLMRIPGLDRLKLSSIEVHEITDELVELFAGEKVLCPHFHLPLQAGCDATLRGMRRKYNTRVFRDRVNALREAIPGAAISTDVIVGFPGESVDDFEESLRFCEEMGFMKIHVFPFSIREGTPAANFSDHVPQPELERRKIALLDLDRRLADAFRRQFIGREVSVLVEGRRNPATGQLTGLTERYLRVEFDGPDRLVGEIVPVVVDGVGEAVVLGSRRAPAEAIA